MDPNVTLRSRGKPAKAKSKVISKEEIKNDQLNFEELDPVLQSTQSVAEPVKSYSPPLVKAEDLNDSWASEATPMSPKTPVQNRIELNQLLIPGGSGQSADTASVSSADSYSFASPSNRRLSLMDSVSKLQASSKSLLRIYMDNQLEQNAEEIAEYEDVIKQLAANIEDLHIENGNLELELANAKSSHLLECDTLKCTLASMESRHRHEMDTIAAELAVERKQIEVLRSENSELARERDFAVVNSSEVSLKLKEFQSNFDEIRCSLCQAEEERRIHQEMLVDKETELDDLKAALVGLRGENSLLSERLNAEVEQTSAADQKLSNALTKLEEFERLVAEQTESMNLLNANAHSDTTKLLQDLQDKNKSLLELSTKYEELRSSKELIDDKLSLTIEEKNAFQHSLNGMETELQDLKFALAEIRQENNLLHESKSRSIVSDNESELKLSEFLKEIEEYKDVIAEQAETIEAMKADLSQYEADFANFQEDLVAKDKEITVLEKLLNEIQDAMKAQRSKIESSSRTSAANTPQVSAGVSLLKGASLPAPFPMQSPSQPSDSELQSLKLQIQKLEQQVAELQSSANESKTLLLTSDHTILQLQDELSNKSEEFSRINEDLEVANKSNLILEATISENTATIMSLQNTIECFEAEIAKEKSQYNALQHRHEELSDKFIASEEAASLLLQEAATQRQRIDSLLASFPAIAGFHQSPREINSDSPRTPSKASRSPRSSDSSTTDGDRISNFHKAVEELTNQLEFERAQVKMKSNRILELSDEWEKTKVELEMKSVDFERQQIFVESIQGELSRLQEAYDGIVFEYQTKGKQQELAYLEACQEGEMKTGEIKELSDEIEELRQLIQDGNEREQSLDEELSHFRFESAGKISALESENQALLDINERSSQLIDSLKSEVGLVRLQLMDKQKEFDEKLTLLALENSDKDKAQASVRDSISHLTAKLEAIINENDVLQLAFTENNTEVANLRAELANKAEELLLAKLANDKIIDSIRSFEAVMAESQSQLMSTVDNQLYNTDGKLQACMQTAATELDSLRAFYEQQLDELQHALETAQQCEEKATEDRLDLLERLRQTVLEKVEVDKVVVELNKKVDVLSIANQELNDQSLLSLDEAKKNYGEELTKVLERLDCSEKRAEQLTINGAQAFAKSSRTIAYLEGECNRLNAIADYYKGANLKLLDNLKVSQEEALKVGRLTHDLQLSAQVAESQKLQLEKLELVLQEKDDLLLENQSALQRLELEYSKQFESARIEWKENHRSADTRLDELKSELATLKSTLELERMSFQGELIKLNADMDSLEQTATDYKNEAERVQLELSEQSLENATQMENIFSLQSQIQALREEIEILNSSMDTRKVEYDLSLTHKNQRIKDLESNMVSLKSSLTESEKTSQVKDDVIASSLLKQDNMALELRHLRESLEAKVEEISVLTLRLHDLTSQCDSLESKLGTSEARAEELESLYQNTYEQVSILEEENRGYSDEIQRLSHEFLETKDSALRHAESAQQSEKRCHQLQTSLAIVEGELQALQSNYDSVAADCQHWQQQLDDVSGRHALLSRDAAQVRTQLLEKENEIELLSNRLHELENDAESAFGQYKSIESFQESLVNEMKAFYNDICQASSECAFLDATASTPSHPSLGNVNIVNGVNLASEFFASPIQVSSLDSLRFDSRLCTPNVDEKRSFSGASTPRQGSLQPLKQAFMDIKVNSLQLVSHMKAVESQLAATEKNCAELRRRSELAEQELLSALEVGKQRQLEITSLIKELDAAHANVAELTNNKVKMVASADNFAHEIRSQLGHLDMFVADVVARSNSALTGRIFNSANGESTSVQISIAPNHKQALQIAPVLETAASFVDIGVSSVMNYSVNSIEASMTSMSLALEAVLTDSAMKANKIDALTLQLRDSFKASSKEKEELLARIGELNNAIAAGESNKLHFESDFQKLSRENDTLRALVAEHSNQKDELEIEYKSALENINSLQIAFGEAEGVCLDLNARVKSQLVELTHRMDEIRFLQDQLDLVTKRASGAEMTLQKLGIDCERFKSERDSMHTVKKTLELEIERLRQENAIAAARAQDRSQLDEEQRCKFFAEKLLSAIGSSMDFISSTAAVPLLRVLQTSQDGDESFDVVSSSFADKQNVFSPLGHKLRSQADVGANDSTVSEAMVGINMSSTASNTSLDKRVELALKKLGELRTWSHDDTKAKRLLIEKVEFLQSELARVQQLNSEHVIELKQSAARETERSNELRDRSKQLGETKAVYAKVSEELDHIRDELQQQSTLLEDERRSKNKLALEVQAKETDIKRLTLKAENLDSVVKRNDEDICSLNKRIAEILAEKDAIADQLQATKANNARLSASLGLLEKGLDRDMSDRGALQQKLSLVQTTASESMRLKIQLTELENGLSLAKDQLKSVSDTNSFLDDKGRKLGQENETLKRKLVSAETRLEQLQKEKLALQENVLELNHSLARIGQQFEAETICKTRAEAALAAFSRSERPKHAIENYSALVEEVEVKLHLDEEEQNSLRSINHALKLALDEREAQRAGEQSRNAKLEKDISTLKQKLARAITDLSDANTKASVLRAQGRNARNQVLETVNMIRASIDLIRTDSLLLGGKGVDALLLVENDESMKEHSSIGLEEALGVPELTAVVKHLQKVVAQLHQAGQARNVIEMEATIHRLEQQNRQLHDSLTQSEQQTDDRLSRMRDEIQSQQISLLELRRLESSHSQVSRQLSTLEAIVKQERDEKDKAVAMCGKLQNENNALAKELSTMIQESMNSKSTVSQAVVANEIQQMREQLDEARRDLHSTRKELSAVSHHRQTLREAVDQLEKLLKSKCDALVSYETASALSIRGRPAMPTLSKSVPQQHSFDDGIEADDQQVRQSARLRARAACAEEVTGIYRNALMALYPDGSSYGAAQHQLHSLPSSTSNHRTKMHPALTNSGWFQREIDIVKFSFEEESRLLEAEVIELRGKLKQSQSYVSELRKRFEDNMKALYRSGHGDRVTDTLHMQIEQLTGALHAAEDEARVMNSELEREKLLSRKRHNNLVDEFGRSVSALDAGIAVIRQLHNYENDSVLEALQSINADWERIFRDALGHSLNFVKTNASKVFEKGSQPRQAVTKYSRISSLAENTKMAAPSEPVNDHIPDRARNAPAPAPTRLSAADAYKEAVAKIEQIRNNRARSSDGMKRHVHTFTASSHSSSTAALSDPTARDSVPLSASPRQQQPLSRRVASAYQSPAYSNNKASPLSSPESSHDAYSHLFQR